MTTAPQERTRCDRCGGTFFLEAGICNDCGADSDTIKRTQSQPDELYQWLETLPPINSGEPEGQGQERDRGPKMSGPFGRLTDPQSSICAREIKGGGVAQP